MFNYKVDCSIEKNVAWKAAKALDVRMKPIGCTGVTAVLVAFIGFLFMCFGCVMFYKCAVKAFYYKGEGGNLSSAAMYRQSIMKHAYEDAEKGTDKGEAD